MAKLGPLPDVQSCIKLRYIGTKNSVAWVNVLHMRYSGAPPDVNGAIAVANAAAAAWNTNLAPLLPTNVQLVTTEVTDLSSRNNIPQSPGTAHSGGDIAAGNDLGNQAAMVISLYPQQRYRGGHPRMYLPAPGDAHVQSGHTFNPTWLGTAKTSAQAWYTAMNAITAGGSTYSLVCVSYYTHDANHLPIYKPVPDVWPILGTTIHSRLDTQRRRLGKETV